MTRAIVCGVDGSRVSVAALNVGAAFAERLGVRLVLAHVAEPGSFGRTRSSRGTGPRGGARCAGTGGGAAARAGSRGNRSRRRRTSCRCGFPRRPPGRDRRRRGRRTDCRRLWCVRAAKPLACGPLLQLVLPQRPGGGTDERGQVRQIGSVLAPRVALTVELRSAHFRWATVDGLRRGSAADNGSDVSDPQPHPSLARPQSVEHRVRSVAPPGEPARPRPHLVASAPRLARLWPALFTALRTSNAR
jgi:hypothetical protein